jgi:anti-repressor protein
MQDGEPWWVASDVCGALEIGNSRMALSRLDDDEKGVTTADTLGGKQELSVVNESGLYSLILKSRKQSAKRFKKWVTGEVLPSIRKTGTFGAPAVNLADASSLRGLLLGYTEQANAARDLYSKV